MAVRNLHAILQHGRMIAEEKKIARNLKLEQFWLRVNKILATRKDAIDCIDTISALYKSGLRTKFEEWMKCKPVRYYGDYLYYSCHCAHNERAVIKYYPKKNYLRFEWNGYGMCSSYETDSPSQVEYLLDCEMKKEESNGYEMGLTKFAAYLQIFLDNFFEWVEKL